MPELLGDGQMLPRRTVGQRRMRWGRGEHGAVHEILTNPAYAGAFVFGRTRQEKRLRRARPEMHVRTIEVPIEQWSVCLPEHHPGYVSWDQYLASRERLRANVSPAGQGGGAARRAARCCRALVRCGRCGRRMQVAYSGNDGQARAYACVRGPQRPGHRQHLQSLGGAAAGEGGRRRVP